jgi:hypothetical protein
MTNRLIKRIPDSAAPDRPPMRVMFFSVLVLDPASRAKITEQLRLRNGKRLQNLWAQKAL